MLNANGQRQSSTNITFTRNTKTTRSVAGFQQDERGVRNNFNSKRDANTTKLPSQSPVDIITDKTIDADYASFRFENYGKIFPESLKNNGETGIFSILYGYSSNLFLIFGFATVKLKIESKNLDEDELPFISGGGLSDRYIFEQLHFHWGQGSRGSEHRIDNEQYKNDLQLCVF